jgi:hypothetical protein
MPKGMSACGVMCSGCAAYLGEAKGLAHQKRTVAAWRRIYGLKESATNISCGGCLAPDDQVFHTSVRCKARLCCRSKDLESCAECFRRPCPDLEKAQSVWDGVPELVKSLSPADIEAYAQPYCGHRKRLAAEWARRRTKSPRRG